MCRKLKRIPGEYICKATLCTSSVGAVTNLYLLTYRPPNICKSTVFTADLYSFFCGIRRSKALKVPIHTGKSLGGSHIRTFDNFYYNFNGYADYYV